MDVFIFIKTRVSYFVRMFYTLQVHFNKMGAKNTNKMRVHFVKWACKL